MGVHIGDGRDETETRLGRMHVRRWTQKPADVSLGHVLNPVGFLGLDLGLSQEQLADLDVTWTNDKAVRRDLWLLAARDMPSSASPIPNTTSDDGSGTGLT